MLELDVFLHSSSVFSVSVINANLVFQLNKITFIGVSLFQPNSFPLLVSKEKKLLNLSAHDGQEDKKICQHGSVSMVPIKTSGSSLGNR